MVKLWLQKFGQRDNDTFYQEITVNEVDWRISMQYNFSSFDGDEIIPNDWCRHGFKHVFDNVIFDRTEEELDAILCELNKIKRVW